jgi:hypothetical protein
MNLVKKEPYVRPVLVKHELLRDITAGTSGYTGQKNQNNQGNQGNQNTQ